MYKPNRLINLNLGQDLFGDNTDNFFYSSTDILNAYTYYLCVFYAIIHEILQCLTAEISKQKYFFKFDDFSQFGFVYICIQNTSYRKRSEKIKWLSERKKKKLLCYVYIQIESSQLLLLDYYINLWWSSIYNDIITFSLTFGWTRKNKERSS